MTSQQIEYVMTLAEEKSFSKAAQKLFVTQPSLSQYIMNIEKQLGTALFDRSTSPIKLTSAGEIYLRNAEKIKAIQDNMINQLADIENLKNGSLKIGASTFRASCMLARSVAEFSAKYSGIDVSIIEDSPEKLKSMLKNGELDVIVGTGKFDPSIFHREELAEEKLYLAIPKNNSINDRLIAHRLTAQDIKNSTDSFLKAQPVDTKHLGQLSFVCAERGEFGADTLNHICSSTKIKPEITLRVKTIETVFAFTTAELGAAIIPDTLIKFGNYAVHPYYYSLDEAVSTKSISLISKKNGYFSKAATQYCLMLKKLVAIGTWRIK